MFLYSLSGSIPKEHKWRYMFGINEQALDGCMDPKQLPAWLKAEDLGYYANEYSRTVEFLPGSNLMLDVIRGAKEPQVSDLSIFCVILVRDHGGRRFESASWQL
jgi:hypothetical protein